MLKPDYFYGKPDRLIEMYQELENWILQDIAVRLLKADELTATADRELWKLQQMELHKKEIIKRISKLTGISQREVKRLLKESVMTSFSDDKEVLENLMELTPPMKNKTIIDVMNAEMIKTMGELSNLTNTTINQSQTDLLNLLNEVDFRVAAGLQSYSSAVCEVLDRYAGDGVMINYPTGSRRSLEAAVRCCIVTSMNQTAAQVTNQYIVESGAEYVLVSAHYGARHDEKNPNGVSSHDAWQGGVYKINGSDPDTPNLLESTGYDIDTVTGKGHVINPLGLHGYNCRHSHKPWMKSLGNPNLDENGNVKVDIHESQKIYELQQKQRAIERAIRKTKRQLLVKDQEKKQYPDELSIHEEYDKLEQKLRDQNKMYNEFCKENGLQPQYDRVKVAGFGKQKESNDIGQYTANQISTNVQENAHRTKGGGKHGVNWKIVKSKEYTERFSAISDNKKANELAAKRSRNALANRDGKDTEELYAISLTTGKDVSSIVDQNYQYGVKRTVKLTNDVKRAEDFGEKVLFIHNHPGGTPPSVEDLNALLENIDAVGITVGHNGSIYYYTKPDRKITSRDVSVAGLKNSMYNGIERRERILEELSRQFNFEFRRL